MFEPFRATQSGPFTRFLRRFIPKGLTQGFLELTRRERFPDGQGRLLPLSVLANDVRLEKPLRSIGCQVLFAARPLGSVQVAEMDAVAFFVQNRSALDTLSEQISALPAQKFVMVCSPKGKMEQAELTAALLHAGLTEILQTVTSRFVLTAGHVPTHSP
ncbi:MAG TPA: hypothetical protein PKE31_09580 [Pseudomonadota bacterium]|nr:hypothetical protein [Pseudomonadota bacterium]